MRFGFVLFAFSLGDIAWSFSSQHRARCKPSVSSGGRLFSTVADSVAAEKVPMTLLAGFLGSGKTTTLQKLLENNDGLKIGIIVNDVAKINIDNKLLAKPTNSVDYSLEQGASSAPDTIELQNGCACCSLADELLTSVEKILSEDTNDKTSRRDLDLIVVELSGVADPVVVRNNWDQAASDGHPATKIASLEKVVTLLDSSTFGTDWMSWDTSGDREGWEDPDDNCSSERKVPELLAEQVEAADVLIVNKVDLAGDEQVKVASALARSLNDKASLFETKFGDVSVRDVLSLSSTSDISNETPVRPSDTTRADKIGTASICTADSPFISGVRPFDTTKDDKIGITNFCYTADRPFMTDRLFETFQKWPVPIKEELDLGQLAEAADEGYDVDGFTDAIKSPFVGVLRSKGFCWISPTNWNGPNEDVWRHNTAMYLSQAGKHFSVAISGVWWATISKEEMKSCFVNKTKEYDRILKEDFVTEEFGDRRQEIVFIGVSINQEEITKALDKCLATDKEMENYRKQAEKLI
jgi:G3E family GTPase